ncbi:hypothetical protein HMPREF2534_01561 [Bacteroides thetaiotaomicron]|nr:hypothetical protein HMPREF2534_01561 [Bacteroides thetaiotaomicron]
MGDSRTPVPCRCIIGRVYMKKGCFPIASFKYNFCIMVHLLEKSRMFAIKP